MRGTSTDFRLDMFANSGADMLRDMCADVWNIEGWLGVPGLGCTHQELCCNLFIRFRSFRLGRMVMLADGLALGH